MDRDTMLVAVGASTGGITALKQLLAQIPADFPAPILVVMHVGAYPSILPTLLAPSSRLPVRHAEDGAPLAAGTVLVAPGDRHLLVEGDRVRLSAGPKENHARPAIDPLFRSAAIAHRSRVVGVVLTGQLDDGTVGLQVIKRYGGIAIVQDPAEAEAPSMPQSALSYVDIDYCLPLQQIGATLCRLAHAQRGQQPAAESELALMENRFAAGEDPGANRMDQLGSRSAQTCPECGGILWEIDAEPPLRYRCHTGHAFTADSLLALQSRSSEEVLWSAVRALHEKHTLLSRMAHDAKKRNNHKLAAEHEAAARMAADHAQALRAMIGVEAAQQ
jgi:two-component system chemotaxis response regulator CheB